VGTLYGFAYHDKALAFLQSLEKKLRRQIVKHIEKLAGNPTPKGFKPLKGVMDGSDKVYRVRSGDYRILYVIRNPTIVILDIDNRKDVYR
jgi:mRNA interferase RelE/StbE